MLKLVRTLFMITLVISLVYLVGFAYINSHEFIHKQIFQRYDIPSESYFNYKFLSGYTYAEDVTNCNDNCKMQHSFNDIFGYYLAVFIFNTWALFIAWFFYNRLYRGGKNES
jgi:hypothetical protein